MNISTLFILKWKSFIRHPLVEQTIMIRLLLSVYIVALFSLLYFFGFFLEKIAIILFHYITSSLITFICLSLILLPVDFILKFLFKKSDINHYTNLLRFHESKKSIYIFIVLKEFFNLWNYYLVVVFISFINHYLHPDYGLLNSVIILFFLCLAQILISLWIVKIKSKKPVKTNLSVLLLNIFPENTILNYLFLSVKMIIRSPRLRYQLLFYSLLTSACLYLIQHSVLHTNSFLIQLLLTNLLFSTFALNFNQFLYSAEAAFFDHLMITPDFQKNMTAKYILYLLIASILFVILLFMIPFSWFSFIELTAAFFYGVGVITLLSFCSIMFMDTKMKLFGSFYKSFTNTHSMQSLIMAFIFSLSISLVIFISWLFSQQTAIYYMLISGITFIIFNQRWFNYLYRCFRPNKYEKLEIFRTQ